MELNKVEFIKNIGQTLKILYVEDNNDAREQTLKMLENFFPSIEVAYDGECGLTKYKNLNYQTDEDDFDLVITDINMPKLDGLSMCKEILSINPSQHILVVSAYNETEQLQKIIDIGVSQYIHKPIELVELVDTFYKLVQSINSTKNKENHVKEVQKLNFELDSLVNSFDKYVIASRTDLKGQITYASKAYEHISGYTEDELMGKPHSLVRHPDMSSSIFKEMWQNISSGNVWKGDIKNLRKDGSFYWVKATVGPYYDKNKNHIGYSAIREDITAQKEVEELHKKVNDLLNNAGQGFLSFDKNLKIEGGYSKQCLNIFKQEDIKDKNISKLIFDKEKIKQDLFCEGIQRILESDNDLSKELLLSLIPSEQTINEKTIHIDYKLLDGNRFMAILTDITNTIKLEQKLKKQSQNQKMIVAVASNKNEFLEIKFDFENFLGNIPEDTNTLLRELHTYKGIFSQKEMVNVVKGIHALESKIKKLKSSEDFEQSKLNTLLKDFDLRSKFQRDLDLISLALGEKFLEASCTLNIDNRTIDTIETKINEILNENTTDIYNQIENLLIDIQKIKYESLEELLSSYKSFVKHTASKCEKYINPLIIKGDSSISVPPTFKPFIKSLVHVFNNCIDHGIEDMETRVENGKDEMGNIYCSFEEINNNIYIEIEDDGAGIDIDKLSNVLIEKGRITKDEIDNISEEDKVYLVFENDLSTKDSTSTISGRGVGMSSIKDIVDKLNGDIIIENRIKKGVKFKFTIPLTTKKENINNFHYRIINSIMEQFKLYLEDHSDFKILDENIVNNYEINKDCSIIKLSGDYKGQIVFSFPKEVIKSIVKYLIPEGFSEEETKEMMLEIPHEIANIVVGLAIQNFPLGYKDTLISPPLVCDSQKLKTDIKWASHCIIKQLKTTSGIINCILIQE
jgi:two-component system chemotaxis sensor kinase CheA